MAEEIENQEQQIQKEEIRLLTHTKIDQNICGKLIDLDVGAATVLLETTHQMGVDQYNLVHSGFVFSAAAFAAVAAMNDPNCIVIGADVKFLAPIEVGNEIVFNSKMLQKESKKREVLVTGSVLEIKVFEGLFYLVTFDKHILKLKLSIS